MSHLKPAHLYLQNGVDLGVGWIEKLDNGDLHALFTYGGKSRVITIGGSIGLSRAGHFEADTYTLMGVALDDLPR